MKHTAATARAARARRTMLAAPTIAAVALLAACSGGDADTDAADAPADGTTTSTTSTTDTAEAATETTETAGATEAEVSANGVTVKVSPAEDIADGSEITVTLSGLNPAYGGYYLGICGDRPEGSPAPACTGDRTVPGTQAWLSNRGGTQPVPENGEASVTLTAMAAGEGVDCRTDSCTLKVFGDHSEGFEDIVDVPVTFAP
ncbi:thiamine biosynthesis protein [Corynebacterium freneyi]|uniref:Thiamine biosynthesis protein n=1 Tax=Corynebacterium freneyi TaxID=134034 RepID=A0ABS4UB95_9CORY|nr:thiamine biosynthesis protein [Corynebacterium freneyi]MBP2333822.1 hypothetical protein [Corynebacterium freneyi]QXA52196.1 thiamine biosynthesis protein [Corynebacterium freneyi]WJZ04076.1 hypothetical protein CFREN_00370 [Corynebacterium freneyi]